MKRQGIIERIFLYLYNFVANNRNYNRHGLAYVSGFNWEVIFQIATVQPAPELKNLYILYLSCRRFIKFLGVLTLVISVYTSLIAADDLFHHLHDVTLTLTSHGSKLNWTDKIALDNIVCVLRTACFRRRKHVPYRNVLNRRNKFFLKL